MKSLQNVVQSELIIPNPDAPFVPDDALLQTEPSIIVGCYGQFS